MRAKLTIQELQQVAEKRGGLLLSKKYFDARTKLTWKCNLGHIWKATPDNIKRGKWCPKCRYIKIAQLKRLGIEKMQQVAEARNGKCLSEDYKNNRSKLLWKCHNGHTWEAAPQHILRGQWCPVCSGKITHDIQEMKDLAKLKGGKCLSEKYIDNKSYLNWQCLKGHTWKAIPHNILRGQWCPICARDKFGESQRLSIQEMQNLAIKRGGKCLSNAYRNVETKLKWQCSKGHIWEAVPASIRFGTWCPYCSAYLNRSEKICRKVFEEIFKTDFPKYKPSWLINDRGNHMELDGYSEKFKLAFEYQGEQHYAFKKMFHENISLKQRMLDDSLKKRLCNKHKITLIEVPFSIPIDKLQEYILEQCKSRGVNTPDITKKINFKSSDIDNGAIGEDMQRIANERGGICISDVYFNTHTRLLWQCRRGHQWEATPHNIKAGLWCPYCAGNKKLNLESIIALAASKNGACLSKKYINTKTKLQWECSKGHKWFASPEHIKRGQWCPICGIEKRVQTRTKNYTTL